MLSNNVFSFLILAAIGLGLVYLFRRDSNNTNVAPVNNDGRVIYGQNAALAQDLALEPSTPAIATNGCPTMPTVPMGGQLCQEQVDNIVGPNCQTMSGCGANCDYRLMKTNDNILPYPQVSNNYAPQTAVNQQFSNTLPVVNPCFGGRDVLSATDLLPREDGYNVWQAANPQSQGALTDQNYLESGHHFGINTVGQSLKNANLQLRSDPIIPKRDIGPFLQSSFGPDTNRRFFEIGQC